jgi:hypothetical protein
MAVETFEVDEVKDETVEECAEARELYEKLGIESHISHSEGSEKVAENRCPYREITSDELKVYRVLTPKQYSLRKYAQPIPLRVLQVAAHANDLGIFKRLEVWDRASALIPDPVLVAHTKGEYESNNKIYILARWGDELEHLSVLITRAAGILAARIKKKLANMMPFVEAGVDLDELTKIASKVEAMPSKYNDD